MFERWKVLAYLKAPENQDVSVWPAVLPCEDETILVASNPPGKDNTIQTSTYEVDVNQGTVHIGDWTKIHGEALHVQKLPMPGWALLNSLT